MNIKTNETYTCLLNSKGKIYTFGWNDCGQCDIQKLSFDQNNISSSSFSQIESCKKVSFLMNNKGEIYKGIEKYNGLQFSGLVSNHDDVAYAWKDNIYYKFQENNIGKYKINLNVKKK